ncbi:MAG TPA: secondary thiamine-phosphate synthase enzyme YjbQ [bacterium]|nr:secondary thiamine-phosphate synthase enzyme YjbQ [bacterium]
MVHSHILKFHTRGDGDIIDLTADVEAAVGKSKIRNGIVVVCAVGSTAAVSTIEHEPGLLRDWPALMNRLVPAGVPYAHDQTWGDGNGYAHLRSTLVGTSFTAAVSEGKVARGTWQQIVFLEFDNRPRDRQVRVQIMGE